MTHHSIDKSKIDNKCMQSTGLRYYKTKIFLFGICLINFFFKTNTGPTWFMSQLLRIIFYYKLSISNKITHDSLCLLIIKTKILNCHEKELKNKSSDTKANCPLFPVLIWKWSSWLPPSAWHSPAAWPFGNWSNKLNHYMEGQPRILARQKNK